MILEAALTLLRILWKIKKHLSFFLTVSTVMFFLLVYGDFECVELDCKTWSATSTWGIHNAKVTEDMGKMISTGMPLAVACGTLA